MSQGSGESKEKGKHQRHSTITKQLPTRRFAPLPLSLSPTPLTPPRVTVKGKNPVSYDTLSVRGNTIRLFILPDGLNLDALLVEDKLQKVQVRQSERAKLRLGGGLESQRQLVLYLADPLLASPRKPLVRRFVHRRALRPGVNLLDLWGGGEEGGGEGEEGGGGEDREC